MLFLFLIGRTDTLYVVHSRLGGVKPWTGVLSYLQLNLVNSKSWGPEVLCRSIEKSNYSEEDIEIYIPPPKKKKVIINETSLLPTQNLF